MQKKIYMTTNTDFCRYSVADKTTDKPSTKYTKRIDTGLALQGWYTSAFIYVNAIHYH